MVKILTPAQFTADLQKQVRALGPDKRRRFMRKVVGPVMQSQVIVRFLRGGYERAKDWVSAAVGPHIFNDRWSERYAQRPSGRFISASSIRMVDTGQLANSYRVLNADSDSVTVGPGARSHNGAGEKIAERAENEGNTITGFTAETISVLDSEMQWYLDAVAEGIEPPYLRKSRLVGAARGMAGMRTT